MKPQSEMTGLEFVRALVSGELPHNSMARTLGYKIVEADEGRVVFTYVPSAEHMNPHSTIHGGWSSRFPSSAPSRRRRASCAPKAGH